MTLPEVMQELEALGSEQTRKVFTRHGARQPFFGVKVADLKKLQKRIKTNHALALELYQTGNSDAMYLAGMIVDPSRMSRQDLQRWVEGAYWYMLSEWTVADTAALSPFGLELALEWIDCDSEMTQTAGWGVLSYLSRAQTPPPHELLAGLLRRVEAGIHQAKNRVRYTMNNFVICVGGSIPGLRDEALRVAHAVGKVTVDMNGTACKVPSAPEYIAKMLSHKAEKSARV